MYLSKGLKNFRFVAWTILLLSLFIGIVQAQTCNRIFGDHFESTTNAGNGNQSPIANAGTDQAIEIGATVNLTSSGSAGPDGGPITYHWTFISQPMESTATFINPNNASATFIADRTGSYIVQLSVTDNNDGCDTDTIVITAVPLDPALNAPPLNPTEGNPMDDIIDTFYNGDDPIQNRCHPRCYQSPTCCLGFMG